MSLPRLRLRGGMFLVLTALLLTSCSTPPHREFAATEVAGRSVSSPIKDDAPLRIDADVADLTPLLEQVIARRDVPAIAALVLRGDNVIARGAVGIRRRGTRDRVTMEDQFEIASCAKAMSALVIGALVQQGKLDWDQPVSRYFPGETLRPEWDNLTLRHLLTHTAGLHDPLGAFLMNTYFAKGGLPEKRSAFVMKVLRSQPATGTVAKVAYCNTDYIVAGVLAEKVTGKPWEQLMRELVFEPLHLDSAGFGPPGARGELNQPWGHGRFRALQLGLLGNLPFDPGARTADYPAMASPAGYVHLSLGDWAKFVSHQLRGNPANPRRRPTVFSEGTYATLEALRPGADYAGGWFLGTRPWAKGVQSSDTGRVLFHVGNNGRWTSACWVAPELDFAVLIVCNRGGMEKAIDEAAGALVKKYARPN